MCIRDRLDPVDIVHGRRLFSVFVNDTLRVGRIRLSLFADDTTAFDLIFLLSNPCVSSKHMFMDR